MKIFKSVITIVFIASSVFAANTNQVHSARPVPGYIQKAVSESQEIRNLMDQVRAESDLKGKGSVL